MATIISRGVRLVGEAHVKDLAAPDAEGLIHRVAVWTALEKTAAYFFVAKCRAKSECTRKPRSLSDGVLSGPMCSECWVQPLGVTA